MQTWSKCRREATAWQSIPIVDTKPAATTDIPVTDVKGKNKIVVVHKAPFGNQSSMDFLL